MARPEVAPAPRTGGEWLVTSLFVAAVGVALWGLSPVFDGAGWWLQGVVVAGVVLVGAAVVRSFARRRFWGLVAGLVIAIAVMTLLFAAPTALLGVVPTWDSLVAFRELEAAGNSDILNQQVPAEATEGIRFLVCLGVALVALAIEAIAHAFRAPALAGLPLLVLLMVPSFVRSEFTDLAPFVITAALWLAAVVRYSRTPVRGSAIAVGAAAIAAALLVPLAVPAGAPPEAEGGPVGGFTVGLSPMITLGSDLRRGEPTDALTYRTSDNSAQYLRLTALDDFSGETWESTRVPEPGADISVIGPVPGASDAVQAKGVTTNIAVADVLTRWLPVPYAATGIRGLEGSWSWEPDGLTVRSGQSNAREQDYQVDSLQAQPSVEQLEASGTGPFEGMEDYLALPEALPEIVRTTALEVTAGRSSHYASAVALQDFFRNGTFEYSESTPVEEGYDGSGAGVLGTFLEVRAGYCVHFSSAMAAMARSLGIPSRVVVGFTPGEAFTTASDSEFTTYRVTTDDYHAWPELYFDGIGWVRFEPTPGRGSTPAFAQLTTDDPSTPDVDESVPTPPTPAPSLSAPPTTAPDAPLEVEPESPAEALGPDATPQPFPVAQLLAAALVLLLFTPAVVRALSRARRLSAVGRGSALDGWTELRDTAYDLGLASDMTFTPRQLADDLGAHLDDDGAAALARFRASLESQAFAREGTSPAARDLRRVLRALRRDAGIPRALAATFVPLSLVRAWLPARETS